MKKSKILFYILLAFVLWMPQASLAISQISTPIVIKNVLRGSQLDQKFMVLNSSDKEITYQLEVVGDINDWITLYDINSPDLAIDQIAIPAKSNAYAGIRFNIPDDTPNGEYRSVVDIIEKLKKDSSEENSVNINLKLSRGIQVIVSDKEIVDFNTTIIPDNYNLDKNDFLVFRVRYRNNGNIKIAPQIQIKIKRGNTIIHNIILPYPENEPWVGALSVYEIPKVEVPLNLDNGTYQAEIDILYNNQVIDTQSFEFIVGKQGFVLGIKDIKINWYIIGGAILIILIALALVLSKKFRIKKVNV